MRLLLSMMIAMCMTIASVAVFAAEEVAPEQHARHKPPQAAFEACKSLTEHSACQFNGRNDQTITGVCSASQVNGDDKTLACRPSHGPKEKASKE